MIRETYVIPRDSRDEVTVAVLNVEFTQGAIEVGRNGVANLLKLVKAAVTDWVKTAADGREAWEDSNEDFNIGDLMNHSLDPINQRLDQRGVRIVDLSCYSMDADNGPWTYDTILVDKEALEEP